jgi:protein involved in polysaccharide export with SLBB domain
MWQAKHTDSRIGRRIYLTLSPAAQQHRPNKCRFTPPLSRQTNMNAEESRTLWHRARFTARYSALVAVAGMTLLALLPGCASLTNPIANGVPVHMLPDELLAESREGFQQIPLTMLRQKPPEHYILAPGDTLGIFIEGILGEAEAPPPVNVPDSPELPLSIGYPFAVREDGTISLPYVDPIKVAGLSVEEAEKAVAKAYEAREILRPQDRRIIVTLMRPRYISVLILRDDSAQRQLTLQTQSLRGIGTSTTQVGEPVQGEGLVLQLPAYQNDVLNALTRSGGLPGLESTQEVIIQRGTWDPRSNPTGTGMSGMCWSNLANEPEMGSDDQGVVGNRGRGIVRIPMRVRPGESFNIRPEDIILQNGDIVMVKRREPEFYYTGGLLPANEVPLPTDYDLTVVEAVLKGQGPLLNGGLNSSNLSGAITGTGVGNPSPSLLSVIRKVPNGGQLVIRVDLNDAVRDPRENIIVQSADILVLQESPQESITRYVTQTFQLNFFGRFLNRQDAQGSISIVAP